LINLLRFTPSEEYEQSMFHNFFKKIIRSLTYKEWMEDILLLNTSSSGVSVTETTALNLGSVWACIQVLAQTTGSIPLKIFKRISDTEKQAAPEHPLYNILHLSPNPEMTSYSWRSLMMYNVCLTGNFYCEIQRNRGGQIIALWPLPPNNVTLLRSKSGKIYYKVVINTGPAVLLRRDQVFHFKGLSSNGLQGLAVLSSSKEAVGLALAAQKSVAKFFKNNSVPYGVYETEKVLEDPAFERLKKSLTRAHEGLENAHRIALLECGLKFKQTTISPRESQLLDSRKYTPKEIARFYRMPLHKIQDMDAATNNNIEQQALEFVSDTMLPWFVNFEQEAAMSLLSESDLKEYFIEYVVEGLLRADIKTRYSSYQIGINNGWLNADEIRAKENMNNLPNGKGKIYYMPANIVPIGRQIEKKEPSNAK